MPQTLDLNLITDAILGFEDADMEEREEALPEDKEGEIEEDL